MRSEPHRSTMTHPEFQITGRCYCGAVSLRSEHPPRTVAYCHCSDCKRWTGAPVAAFAAFLADDLHFCPDQGAGRSHAAGVTRWNCKSCGSPLQAAFDYLPDQVYVPLGLIDQADDLPPQLHCHSNSCYSWLSISDEADRAAKSGRSQLNEATGS
ncbi:GFA family protein [uncultured Shimia sp.]|uniref:GFA family protein n=1 Tax=uncultured Shimia sp. TaxID=573152 RepID=UPI00261983C8|nr:GFA family protein [uncultured Shimia sp.]